MHPALRLLAADDGAVVVDDVGVDGADGVAEGDVGVDEREGVDGRDELGRSSGSDSLGSGGRESDTKFGFGGENGRLSVLDGLPLDQTDVSGI